MKKLYCISSRQLKLLIALSPCLKSGRDVLGGSFPLKARLACGSFSGQAVLLPRNLSALETWGFDLSGHVGWIGTAPAIHAALSPNAIFVWLPGVIVAMLLNLQVQQLGKYWPNISEGMPNYAAQLLEPEPPLGRYIAIAYSVSWIAAPAIYEFNLVSNT